jgi:hypothetical protein
MYLRELGVAANAILLCLVWTRKTDLAVDLGEVKSSVKCKA